MVFYNDISPETKKVFVIFFAVCLLILSIPTIYFLFKHQGNLPTTNTVTSPKAPYQDNGKGMVIIQYWGNLKKLENNFSEWKKQFPQKNIICSTMDQEKIIIFYNTKK